MSLRSFFQETRNCSKRRRWRLFRDQFPLMYQRLAPCNSQERTSCPWKLMIIQQKNESWSQPENAAKPPMILSQRYEQWKQRDRLLSQRQRNNNRKKERDNDRGRSVGFEDVLWHDCPEEEREQNTDLQPTVGSLALNNFRANFGNKVHASELRKHRNKMLRRYLSRKPINV